MAPTVKLKAANQAAQKNLRPPGKEASGLPWVSKQLGGVIALVCLLAAWQLAQRKGDTIGQRLGLPECTSYTHPQLVTCAQYLLPAGTPSHSASSVGLAYGVYPVGCKWRDVQPAGQERGFWDVVKYEYWSNAAHRWVSKMPEECMVKGEDSTRR